MYFLLGITFQLHMNRERNMRKSKTHYSRISIGLLAGTVMQQGLFGRFHRQRRIKKENFLSIGGKRSRTSSNMLVGRSGARTLPLLEWIVAENDEEARFFYLFISFLL
ncbi:hypothetical protein CEXT_127121 [Caerostris extrusa]|uniref:Uncharacterized protein n=1 Tax=Caerostris extrusa TaxID=172846 RepID=A0AAV4XDR4_CAEEX|nr:hypothetical protein CEXT_127121 [Caerostris extrusa]